MTPWEEYHQDLLALHIKAGAPAIRTIAERAGGKLSNSSINLYLNGERLPKWGSLLLLIRALDAEPETQARFRDHWEHLNRLKRQARLNRDIRTEPKSHKPPMSAANSAILAELEAIRALMEELVGWTRALPGQAAENPAASDRADDSPSPGQHYDT